MEVKVAKAMNQELTEYQSETTVIVQCHMWLSLTVPVTLNRHLSQH